MRVNIDALNAQSQFFQTKRDLAVARYNVLLGGLRLRQANGTLTPEDFLLINSLLVQSFRRKVITAIDSQSSDCKSSSELFMADLTRARLHLYP